MSFATQDVRNAVINSVLGISGAGMDPIDQGIADKLATSSSVDRVSVAERIEKLKEDHPDIAPEMITYILTGKYVPVVRA